MNEKVKKPRSYLVWLGFLFGLGLLGGALPGLLSRSFVVDFALERMTGSSGVEVHVDAVKFRWPGVQELWGLSVRLPDGTVFSAEHLEVRKRLISLWRERDLGEVVLTHPQVRFPEVMASVGGRVSVEGASGGGAGEVKADVVGDGLLVGRSETPGSLFLFEWPGWKAVLRGESGEVYVGDALLVRDWETRIDLNQGESLSTFSVRADSASRDGRVVFIGALKRGADGGRRLGGLAMDMTLTARGFDLSPFRSLLSRFVEVDVLEGVVTLEGEAKGSIEEGVEVGAEVSVKRFAVEGSFIEGDRLVLPSWRGEFIGRVGSGAWTLNQFEMRSDLVCGSLHGSAEGGRMQDFKASLRVDLAAVAGMLPHTLGLREGLRFQEGVAVLDLDVACFDGMQEVKGAVKVQDLQATLNGKPLSVDYTIGSSFVGRRGSDGFDVGRCLIRAPFFTLTGKGNVRGFILNVEADLDALVHEVGAFHDLQGWGAGGSIVLNAEAGGGASGGVEVDVAFSDFRLSHEGEVFFSGQVDSEVAFSMDGECVDVGYFEVSGRDVDWRKGARKVHQEAVDVRVDDFRFSRVEGAVQVGSGELKVDAGTLRLVGGLELSSWSNVVSELNLDVDFDLKKAQVALYSLGVLPDTVGLSGEVFGSIKRSGSEGYVADVELSDVSVSRGEALLLGKGSYHFEGSLRPGTRVWRLPRISLESDFFTLSAAGVVKHPRDNGVLLMQGDLSYDLERLNAHFPVLASQDVFFKGRSARPFRFKMPLGKLESVARWKALNLAAELLADEVQAYGFVFSQVRVPVSMEGGLGVAKIAAEAGEGRICLVPRLNGGVRPAELTLDTSEPVWTNVVLTAELADRVLSRIHPVFKGSTVLEGATTLILDAYSMPVDDGWKEGTVFSGRILLDDVRLSSVGVMGDLLKVLNLDGRALEVGDRVIEFSCVNGRVTSSPISFTVEGYEMTLAGSVGLDQSLDYTLSTPVTRELVGKEVSRYVGKEPLRIPVTGTLSHPRIQSDVVKNIMKGLGASAVEELLEDQLGDFFRDRLKR